MPAPSTTLSAIRDKVRRITGRPSATSITDTQIDEYINTFYLYDFPEHLRLQNLRVNWQFLTQANIPVYDFPTDLFLTVMPPIFIAGYQSYMTQSRESFFRINPELNLLKASVATGLTPASAGPYNFILTPTPILRGFKQNPPGAFAPPSLLYPSIPVAGINWNVLITSVDGNGNSVSLVDDGLGQLWDVGDVITSVPLPGLPRGTINYLTGAVTATFSANIAPGAPINAQFVPYKASRPQSACFFQDQISIYPIPDQAYTVSFECYKKPAALLAAGDSPQLAEWWQALAYGAADKVFTDNADMDNAAKYRPLLDEQLRLIQRRTLCQQASERVSTIYESQQQLGQYPFGNNFSF